MPDSPRPADTTLRARVCGVDCHPGDALCNGYCTGAAEAPPTYTDDRTPLQCAVEKVRDGAEGIGNGARLTARECSALRARLSETREAGEERYWCGCVRAARWTRCAQHQGFEHDEEPPSQRAEYPLPPSGPSTGETTETTDGH